MTEVPSRCQARTASSADLCLVAFFCIVGTVLAARTPLSAQVPPQNDTSDANHNTGSGTGTFSFGVTGAQNSAFGVNALKGVGLPISGSLNTAVGANPMTNNTGSSNNVASGFDSLYYTGTPYSSGYPNDGAVNNVGVGYFSLWYNHIGNQNTGVGSQALQNSSGGETAPNGNSDNTATGAQALLGDTYISGFNDTAAGFAALDRDKEGRDNTASGWNALSGDVTGNTNTANGSQAMLNNYNGTDNVAQGVLALAKNSGGNRNTAVGVGALYSNTSGSDNIGVGKYAGYYVTTGSYNIDVGNLGVAGDSATMRLGTQGTQKATYIAGTYGAPPESTAVCISSLGRLGPCAISSVHYKRDIHDMGAASSGLMKLRPVTFYYKQDSTRPLQYGLIADEVDRVYPELVVHDANGNPESVMYQALPAMLLNEVQKLVRENQHTDREIVQLRHRLENLEHYGPGAQSPNLLAAGSPNT